MTQEEFDKYAASKGLELINEFDGFKVGDIVTFTNDYGVVFYGMVIKGILKKEESWGGRFYIFDDSYWYPACQKNIKHERIHS